MANANKQKGKSLEREVAKELSVVFGLNFERIWSSGAFTGGKNAFRLQKLTPEQALLSTGDILMPMELSHVQMECKFYKDFSWQSVFENNETLNGWIEQAIGTTGNLWFLIMKFNNQGKFVVFDTANKFTIPTQSSFCYKGKYTIVRYDEFFETNKQAILDWKKSQTPLQSDSVLSSTN